MEFASARRSCHSGPAREVAHRMPQQRIVLDQRSQLGSGRRVTLATAAGSIATTRASASASTFVRLQHMREELRAVARRRTSSPQQPNALRAQQREHGGVLGEVLRHAQRFRMAAKPRDPRESPISISVRASARHGSRDVREQRRIERVRLGRPERSRSDGPAKPGPTASAPPEPARAIDRFGVRIQGREVGGKRRQGALRNSHRRLRSRRRGYCRRAARRAAPASSAPIVANGVDSARPRTIKRRTAVGAVGAALDVARRRARLGAEDRGDGRRIARVELVLVRAPFR